LTEIPTIMDKFQVDNIQNLLFPVWEFERDKIGNIRTK